MSRELIVQKETMAPESDDRNVMQSPCSPDVDLSEHFRAWPVP